MKPIGDIESNFIRRCLKGFTFWFVMLFYFVLMVSITWGSIWMMNHWKIGKFVYIGIFGVLLCWLVGWIMEEWL